MLEHFKAHARGAGGVAFVSTPNVLTLAPEGAEKSGNPWHVKEYRAEEFRALCERALRAGRAARPLPRAQAARCTSWRSSTRAGTTSTGGCGITKRVLRPLHARRSRVRDFALRSAERRGPRPRAGLPRRAAARERAAASSRIVLHTHMPYVEGFGTWPFGEEWLWEAMATSLPAAARRARRAARRVTLSLTPVLADQLEAPGVAERFLRVPARACGRATHALDVEAATRERPRRLARRARARRRRLRARRRAPASAAAATCSARSRRTRAWTAAATHAVLPLLATDAGVRLQLADRASRRTGRARRRAWARRLLAAGVRARAVAGPAARGGRRARHLRRPDRRPRPRRRPPLRPLRTPAGPLLVPIDRAAIELVWSDGGYPSHARLPRLPPPARRTTTTPWANDGARLRPGARRGAGARATRPTSSRASRARVARRRARASARWTPSCSATGGTRGRLAGGGARRGRARRPRRSCRSTTRSPTIDAGAAARRRAAASRPGARRATCRRGRARRSPTSPGGARRPSCASWPPARAAGDRAPCASCWRCSPATGRSWSRRGTAGAVPARARRRRTRARSTGRWPARRPTSRRCATSRRAWPGAAAGALRRSVRRIAKVCVR